MKANLSFENLMQNRSAERIVKSKLPHRGVSIGLNRKQREQLKTIYSLSVEVVPVVFILIALLAIYMVKRISCMARYLPATWTKWKCEYSAGVLRATDGSVLMEYVLVQVLVACFLMLMMNNLFYNWSSGSLVGLGLEVKYFFQRLLGGLSLPVP